VAQTQAAGTGISFATATHAMFVSQSFSFTDEEQARDRVYAPNKNRCITYYRCTGTVDEFIASVIKAKGNIHEAVTHADIRQMAWGTLGYRKKKKGM
jgi:SNF2 family DNA or RNA helicase